MPTKIILALVAVFTAIGLNAADTTVEKLHGHYSVEAKMTEPTQLQKNIWDAIDRLENGKASLADKELIKSASEKIMNIVHNKTVNDFIINVDSPSFRYLYALSALSTDVAAGIIDNYSVTHCSTDLTKASMEDLQKGSYSSTIIELKGKTFEYLEHKATVSKEDYVKFVHAALAFNCSDGESLKKYLQKDNEFEGAFLTGLVKEDMGDKPIFMSYKNEAGNECTVIGHTTTTIPSLYERVEIKLEKETCKSGEAFMIKGYVTQLNENLIFSNIQSGDKVKIFKTK